MWRRCPATFTVNVCFRVKPRQTHLLHKLSRPLTSPDRLPAAACSHPTMGSPSRNAFGKRLGNATAAAPTRPRRRRQSPAEAIATSRRRARSRRKNKSATPRTRGGSIAPPLPPPAPPPPPARRPSGGRSVRLLCEPVEQKADPLRRRAHEQALTVAVSAESDQMVHASWMGGECVRKQCR